MEGGSTPAGAAATGRTIERRGAAMRKRKTRRRTEGGIENMIRADAGEGHAGKSFFEDVWKIGVCFTTTAGLNTAGKQRARRN